ncbi:MAG: thioredoxin family protein [Bacteroidota bacterium]
MRRLFTLALTLVSLSFLSAQIMTPVTWSFSVEHVGDGQADLVATAKLDAGWTIYSQELDDGGPVPTTFYWTKGDHFKLIGDTEESGHRKAGEDEFFMMEVVKYLSDEPVVFRQRVEVLDYSQPIEGEVEFMSCNDEQCLPPTGEAFSFSVKRPETRDKNQDQERRETRTKRQESRDKEQEERLGESQEARDKNQEERSEEEEKNKEERLGESQDLRDKNQEERLGESQEARDKNQEGERLAEIEADEPSDMEPLTWGVAVAQLDEKTYEISLTGHLLDGWYTYSSTQDFDEEDAAPLPLELVALTESGFQLVGETREEAPNVKTEFDEVWEMDIAKIKGSDPFVLTQVVSLSGAEQVDFLLDYQVCEEGACIPGGFEFSLLGEAPYLRSPQAEAVMTGVSDDAQEADLVLASISPDPVATGCNEGAMNAQGLGIWKTFLYGILGGLFALFMPCIFPMIPLTVNFFNKSSGSRAKGIQRAGLYGFFIFMVYLLLSVPFHLIEGVDAGILNRIASSVPLNVAFFAVFMIFAGSFFGFYELTLPESWSNKASKAEGRGGLVGIFFMALTLALVSFSCTGPILGSLLAGTASEGAWPLTAGMAGFGLAIGLPFALFAAFPQVLQAMPQSGGWLNSVKVVLGFVEVALAFKFLSNADLVGEWGILKLEPFYLIWIACCIGIILYLLGYINFPHDTKGKSRLKGLGAVTALASLAFAIYLATGFQYNESYETYDPLDLLSGLAPPVGYSIQYPKDCPQGINCFKDLDEGLAYAAENNKPVMLDFTGFTCVNCRKMEENVWSERQIRGMLNDDFVLISLYVDDRSELPVEQQERVNRLDGKDGTILLDRVGEKWHYFQQRVYNYNAQPYYALISPDGQTLNPPVAYTPDVDEYEAFLRCGLDAFEAMKGK